MQTPVCLSAGEWARPRGTYAQWDATQPRKRTKVAISNNEDGLGGHYVKWNKSGRERQTVYDITYMWNLKKNKLKEADSQITREMTGDY